MKLKIALVLTLLLSLTFTSSSRAQIVRIPGAVGTTGVRVIYHIPGLTDEFFVEYPNLIPSISNGVLVISDRITWSAVYANGSWTRIERF